MRLTFSYCFVIAILLGVSCLMGFKDNHIVYLIMPNFSKWSVDQCQTFQNGQWINAKLFKMVSGSDDAMVLQYAFLYQASIMNSGVPPLQFKEFEHFSKSIYLASVYIS